MFFKPLVHLRIFCHPTVLTRQSWHRIVANTLLCIGVWLTMFQQGQSQTFEIDIDHTSLVFAVSHSGLSYTYGRFNQCAGRIKVDVDPKKQFFELTIDSDSIDTNNGLRDDHLRGPDFFDTQAFPEITFRSTSLTKDANIYTATGVLKMHGVEKQIELKLTEIGRGMGPRGKPRIGFFSKFSVKRSDFGIKSFSTIVGNQIAITLSFEGIQMAEPNKKPALTPPSTEDRDPPSETQPIKPREKPDRNAKLDRQFHILEN